MKKTLVALAALAVVGAASAQSTVTLYGKIDVTAQNRTEKFAGAKTAPNVGMEVNSAGLSGSRFGMRGSEDLGGGLKANFQIENGFNVDAGSAAQGGLLFGRQAWVGLSGGFGSVSFGRQYSPIDNQWGANDPQGYTSNSAMNWAWNAGGANQAPLTNAAFPAVGNPTQTYGAATAFSGFHAEPGRINNSIMYTTPAMGGFNAMVMWAPSENKNPITGRSAGSYTGFMAGYAAGPLGVSLGYESIKLTAAANLSAKISAWSLMGQYDFGVLKLYGGYENGKASGAAGAFPVNTAGGTNSLGSFGINGKDKGWLVGIAMPIGAMTMNLGYAREKATDTVGAGYQAKTSAFGGQLVYPLSKRTNMYADFLSGTTQDNNFFFAPGKFKNTILGVGIRHDF